MENFEDLILNILIGAAFVSLVLGIINEGWAKGWIEGVSIFIAIAIIIVVTTGNNYVKEKQFQELQNKQDVTSARVMRNGKILTLDAQQLVVGDVVMIAQGDLVPADCIVLEATTFQANEAGLTGEPDALHKHAVNETNYNDNPCPFVLQNTLVEHGQCTALVAAVGRRTRSGRAERIMNIESEVTPMQAKLETIAELIGQLGFAVATATFIAMIVRMLCQVYISKDRPISDPENLTAVLDAFIIAVTVIVVAVPEGLPLAVTISLAFSVHEMGNKGNLVRRLHASETMGGANEICTDKTGTLTQNRMSVQEIYFQDACIQGERNGDLKENRTIQECVLYNASAYIQEVEDEETHIFAKKAIGNVTEVGLITYLMDSGVDCEEMIDNRKVPGFKVFEIPFNSGRKRATCVIRRPEGGVRVLVKGAPEIVIEYCDNMIGEGGEPTDLDEDKKAQIIGETVKTFASKCYRTLLVAYVDYSDEEWERLAEENGHFETEENQEIVEAGLTMVSIFALMDPLRPGVPKAVDDCHKAGVNVRMCTGDNIDTAIAISKQAHILSERDLADTENQKFVCMTGKDFREEIGGLNT
jgi:P-type Ca2+ transporter type 2B